jgi:hypothetical protein
VASWCLQDCSGYQRSLAVTVGTFNKVAFIGPSMAVTTIRTTKTVWPALREKALSAGRFIIESPVKLH